MHVAKVETRSTFTNAFIRACSLSSEASDGVQKFYNDSEGL